MKQFNKYIFNKNLFNFKDLFDFKKFLFFFYIAILYIIFSDPQKRQWWDYTVPYSQQFFCDSFPRCFRIIDLNLLNISAFFLDKILKVLNIKINNIYFLPHYFFATLSLTYVFYVIKKKGFV